MIRVKRNKKQGKNHIMQIDFKSIAESRSYQRFRSKGRIGRLKSRTILSSESIDITRFLYIYPTIPTYPTFFQDTRKRKTVNHFHVFLKYMPPSKTKSRTFFLCSKPIENRGFQKSKKPTIENTGFAGFSKMKALV